jgi:hypothetical protein
MTGISDCTKKKKRRELVIGGSFDISSRTILAHLKLTFMMSSGLKVPIPEIPIPDLAVPMAAPAELRIMAAAQLDIKKNELDWNVSWCQQHPRDSGR